MSLSDLSLSSPRKGTGRSQDKSLDDEFERFLNDNTESDFTLKKNKVAKKPWWMEEDEDNDRNKTGKQTLEGSRNFVKKRNPDPLPEVEVKFESKAKTNEYDDEEIPKLSLENNSTISTSRDVDARHPKSWDKLNEDKAEDEVEGVEENYYDDFIDQLSSSRKSIQSVIEKKPDDEKQKFNQTNFKPNTMDKSSTLQQQPTATGNLLSKVMFMDSLETGAAGNNTALNNVSKLTEKESEMYKKSETSFMDSTQMDNRTRKNFGANQTGNLTTQTRSDLADIQRAYQNYAITDSGLNTLIRDTNSTENKSSLGEKNDSTENEDERNIHNRNAIDRSTDSSNVHVNSSNFGLKIIKEITNELESELTREVLKELEKRPVASKTNKKYVPQETRFGRRKDSTRNSRSSSIYARASSADKHKDEEVVTDWPPSKYKDVKGTGYGTTWSPKTTRRTNFNESVYTIANSQKKKKKLTHSSSNLNLSSSYLGFDDFKSNTNKFDHSAEVAQLKDQLIRCADENEERLNEMRSFYEKTINEQRVKIADLTSQLNDKNDKLINRMSLFDPTDRKETSTDTKQLQDKVNLLEKNINEQDKLLNGYQIENERLYAEIKQLKSAKDKEFNQLNAEKKQLKLNLIQERLSIDHKPRLNIADKILPLPASSDEHLKQSNINNEEKTNLEVKIRDLTERLHFYEKNQHQIELDVKLIESKNQEIKKLKDNVKSLEMGKVTSDQIKELKRLRQQVKELDSLVKRQRRSHSSAKSPSNPQSDPNNFPNLSLDYYEKRIEHLEKQLKEKTFDLERLNRMWEQKFYLLNKLDREKLSMSDFEFRKAFNGEVDKMFAEMEKKYADQIEHLELSNVQLKERLILADKRANDTEKEKEKLTLEYESYLSRDKNIANLASISNSNIKTYQPDNFKDHILMEENNQNGNYTIDPTFLKDILGESEKLKIKLVNSENALKLASKDYEFEIEKLKTNFGLKLKESNRKHAAEIKKLIKIFTGADFDNHDDESSSVFDDPIKFRLMMKASERYQEINDTKVEKLTNELAIYRQKSKYLLDANKQLTDRVSYLEKQLKLADSPTDDYQQLSEKLRIMERKYQQREREVESIINGNFPTSKSTSYESNYHLDDNRNHSLINYYEQQLRNKNMEIDKFRNELDIMLNLLQTLKNPLE